MQIRNKPDFCGIRFHLAQGSIDTSQVVLSRKSHSQPTRNNQVIASRSFWLNAPYEIAADRVGHQLMEWACRNNRVCIVGTLIADKHSAIPACVGTSRLSSTSCRDEALGNGQRVDRPRDWATLEAFMCVCVCARGWGAASLDRVFGYAFIDDMYVLYKKPRS
jgi:hypothetical protein